jgi:hypothetical protein
MRRPAVIAASVLVLACVAGGGLYLATTSSRVDTGPDRSSEGTPVAPGSGTAATASPLSTRAGTVAGANQLEPGPADVVATDPPPVTDAATAEATVVMSYADFAPGSGIEEGGFVSGLVEDGGTCRVVVSRGAQERTAEVPGAADATTTSCGGLVVDEADLTAGTWSVQLEYRTGATTISSTPVTVEVAP